MKTKVILDSIGMVAAVINLQKTFDKSFVVEPSGCWKWIKRMKDDGYGLLSWEGKGYGAHRIGLFLYKRIPLKTPWLQADHLCRNRWCVNPEHLELVTQQENIARGLVARGRQNKKKSHCKYGHELTKKNVSLYHNKKTGLTARSCRICNYEKQKRYWKKQASK